MARRAARGIGTGMAFEATLTDAAADLLHQSPSDHRNLAIT